jgi:hypothetical protein
MGHQLLCDFTGQKGVQTSADIEICQFLVFADRVVQKLGFLAPQISPLGISLRVNGYIFAGRHGHGSRHKSGGARDQNAAVSAVCCSHPKD